jgi:AraC family transcriptional activator of pyochelin receptor
LRKRRSAYGQIPMNKPYSNIIVNNPNIPVLPETYTSAEFGNFTPIVTCKTVTDQIVGATRSHDMYMPNFSLREFQGQYDQDVVLFNEYGIGIDLLGVCMILRGQVSSFVKNKQEGTVSFNHSHSFKYDPHNELKHLLPANKPFHVVHFSLKTDYLAQVLPAQESRADQLRAQIDRRECFLAPGFSPIVAAQERALQNIFDCPFSGKLGFLMMETSLVQIILLQMYALYHIESQAETANINSRDRDLIHAVRDYITENFLDDHSLASLARQFGTNTNKLMMLFKRAFGKSIFDHITEKRMTFAKEMLNQKDVRIVDVARTLGYKNANHFSTAFKKNYGVNPSAIKV